MVHDSFERVVIESLLFREEYSQKVFPYLKEEYFISIGARIAFKKIKEFIDRFNKPPTKEELLIEIGGSSYSDRENDAVEDLLSSIIKRRVPLTIDWLVETSEKFCKDRAVYNAIIESTQVLEKGEPLDRIQDLLKEALAVSFKVNIGHDYKSQAEARFERLYESKDEKLPFDISILNKVTGGGLSRKTLSVVSATTGAGKTLFLCHCSARYLLAGKNVLYLTLEMSEERISERIDANILDTNIQDIALMSKKEYSKKFESILKNCSGQLIIKEYPTACAGVSHFRILLNELRAKRGFVPDVIIVDYINICASSRYKSGSVNSYQFVKSICEELRGLAVECNVPIISATQFNREGAGKEDVGLTEISESHGLAMTVDILFAMIRTEEMDVQNIVLFKQLKNRFCDIASNLRFRLGINRQKMKLYDLEECGQKTINKNKDKSHQSHPHKKFNLEDGLYEAINQIGI